MNTPCHVCTKRDLENIPQGQNLWRLSSDHKIYPPGGLFFSCSFCGTIQKNLNRTWKSEVAQIYNEYEVYAPAKGAEQYIFTQNGAGTSRSAALLDGLINENSLPQSGRLLDIGCCNGAFLAQASQKLPKWSFVGSDISDHDRERVESIPSVESFQLTDDPLSIDGLFDVITMIHVLEHVPHPADWLSKVRQKLRPNGTLLIAVPDVSKNPYDLLVLDHASHFTLESLSNLLKLSGFKVKSVSTAGQRKELLLFVEQAPINSSMLSFDSKALASRHLSSLEDICQWAVEYNTHDHLGIFGSSLSGSWLHKYLGKKVDFFVEEDPNRVSQIHRGLPIISPSDIPPNSTVINPIPGNEALDIQKRMEKSYPDTTWLTPLQTLSMEAV